MTFWHRQKDRIKHYSLKGYYAKKFIRLSKYASHIVPTENARVKRFKSGLIAPIYNAVLAAEFLTLSKLKR